MAYNVRYECNESLDVLIKRWDYMTSEAFYAGCDRVMDLVFTGTRKGDRVTLIRKAPSMRNTFATVFSGRLISTENGSAIVGNFRKRYSDYFIGVVAAALAYGFAQGMADEYRTEALVVVTVAMLGLLALFKPLRGTKRLYGEFLTRIIRGI